MCVFIAFDLDTYGSKSDLGKEKLPAAVQQLMLVLLHLTDRWDRRALLCGQNFILLLESQGLFNTELECRNQIK